MTAINTVPKGLQAYLGNTSQGVNPSELLPGVRPSLDLTPYWNVDKQQMARWSGTVIGAYNNTQTQIPEGEMWLVHAASCSLALNAVGDVGGTVVQLRNAAGNVQLNLASSEVYTVLAGVSLVTASYVPPQPVFWSAGTVVVGMASTFTPGAVNAAITLDLLFNKIKV